MTDEPPTSVCRTSGRSRWLSCAVAGAIGLLALAHLPVAVIDGYGEDDAAWDGIVAMLWAQHGRLPTETGVFVEERFRSSPLSIWLTQELLAGRFISQTNVPRLMNITGITSGILIPVLFFLWVRRLRSDAEAVIAVVLLLFSPVFFRLKCYGLPTLPALLLLLAAVAAFDGAITRPRHQYVWLVLSAGLWIVAVLMKVDILLLAPVFPCLALIRRHDPQRRSLAGLGGSFPILALLVWHGFCQAVAPSASPTTDSFNNWSQKWAIAPAGLVDRENLISAVMAPGVGTTIAVAVALLLCAIDRRWRWPALAALACTLPTLLFWGMRHLNSSRHNLWVVMPLAILVAMVVCRAAGGNLMRIALVVAMCAGNYFQGPAREDYRTAAAHFFTAAADRARLIRKDHRDYQLALSQHVPGESVCFFPVSRPTARIVAAAVARSDRCEVRVGAPRQNEWHIEADISGRRLRIWIPMPLQELPDLWPRLHDEKWFLVRPRPGEPPFEHIHTDSEIAPSPETLVLSPWPLPAP